MRLFAGSGLIIEHLFLRVKPPAVPTLGHVYADLGTDFRKCDPALAPGRLHPPTRC